MPTYSPEQALARPTGRAPLWGEGLLAAALWLLGGLFTLTWPDAGRRWPFSEGWALAQFTLGGGLLLLRLSCQRTDNLRGACTKPREWGFRLFFHFNSFYGCPADGLDCRCVAIHFDPPVALQGRVCLGFATTQRRSRPPGRM